MCRVKERVKGRNHLTLPAHWPRWFWTKSFMVLFKKEPQGLNTWSSPCYCVFSRPDSNTWHHKTMMLKEQWWLSYVLLQRGTSSRVPMRLWRQTFLEYKCSYFFLILIEKEVGYTPVNWDVVKGELSGISSQTWHLVSKTVIPTSSDLNTVAS